MIISTRAMRLVNVTLMLLFAGSTLGLLVRSHNQQQALDAFWADIQVRNTRIEVLQASLSHDRADLASIKSSLDQYGSGRTQVNRRLDHLEANQRTMQRQINELVH